MLKTFRSEPVHSTWLCRRLYCSGWGICQQLWMNCAGSYALGGTSAFLFFAMARWVNCSAVFGLLPADAARTTVKGYPDFMVSGLLTTLRQFFPEWILSGLLSLLKRKSIGTMISTLCCARLKTSGPELCQADPE